MTLGSLFDGSGTCPLAASMCGITPIWASEIEPYPIRVTKKNFPGMRHLGDITKINGAEIEPVDIVTFGSPCQDLSAAGAQKGLVEGKRSVLFFDAIRIVKEMRGATHGKYPRYVVWENVLGAFSSHSGRDFLAVLRAFVEAAGGHDTDVPEPARKGRTNKFAWRNAGCIVGDGYSIAWRVLDAKHWGVPQRRSRIFLVCDFAGGRAGEILFKRKGLLGDFKACRKARQEDSGDAVGSVGGECRAFHLQQDPISGRVSPCIGAQRQATVGVVYDITGATSNSMKSPTEDSCFRERDVTRTLDTWVNTPECNQGGNVVVYAADCRNLRLNEEISGTLQAKENGGYSLNYQNPVVYQNPKRGEYVESEIGSTLLAHLAVEPRDIVAYDARGNGDGEIVPTLTGDHERRVTDYTALVVGNGQLNQMSMSDKAGALNCMHDQQAVLTWLKKLRRYIVRRLTPLECCRLQGFPDWWEDGVDGSDSARYKMWGNGMALPCVLYVMEGITDGTD
nr:MAG TPA: Cytosine specific methyltransferase [Bacteriophage sp.]